MQRLVNVESKCRVLGPKLDIYVSSSETQGTSRRENSKNVRARGWEGCCTLSSGHCTQELTAAGVTCTRLGSLPFCHPWGRANEVVGEGVIHVSINKPKSLIVTPR